MKNKSFLKQVLTLIALAISISVYSQTDEVTMLLVGWELDVSTAQIDPNDRSKYLDGAEFEAQITIEFSAVENIDSVNVKMLKSGDNSEYFNLTLPIDGSLNTSDIFIEAISGTSFKIHAGKYTNLSDYKVHSQITFSNGEKGEIKIW